MSSDEEEQIPEQEFDVKAGFEMMQEQFSIIMTRMEETARKVDAVASEQTVLRDEVTRTPAKDSPSKTKAILGRKIPLHGLSGSPSRRSSAFYKQATDSQGQLTRVPKMLQDGKAIENMTKYGGKPTENLSEHFITFEYNARRQDVAFGVIHSNLQ